MAFCADDSVLLPQDECSCIGCKQCVWIAPGVYRLEAGYGRSRVFAQWANDEDDIQVSRLALRRERMTDMKLALKMLMTISYRLPHYHTVEEDFLHLAV